ncbi:hypothetical protein Hanom_Chr15g01344501 [Helianthus anomalus]
MILWTAPCWSRWSLSIKFLQKRYKMIRFANGLVQNSLVVALISSEIGLIPASRCRLVDVPETFLVIEVVAAMDELVLERSLILDRSLI